MTAQKSASGCIFMAADTRRLCFQLRSHTGKFPMRWGFWGGKVEAGEYPIDALQREVVEELGFDPEYSKIHPLHKYTSPDRHFEYHSYVVIVDHEFIPILNSESAGYGWFNIGTTVFPLHPGAYIIFNNQMMKDKLLTIASTLPA